MSHAEHDVGHERWVGLVRTATSGRWPPLEEAAGATKGRIGVAESRVERGEVAVERGGEALVSDLGVVVGRWR